MQCLATSDCWHLHCTGTAIRVNRMYCGPGQCAQGSSTARAQPWWVRTHLLFARGSRAPRVCVRAHTHPGTGTPESCAHATCA
jgi:hypothetical protein